MQPKPPTKPTLDGLERKWADRWARSGVYRFDRTRPRVEVFSIDTPPPTVSGSLHLGHAFSYTQTDVIARFQRMRGRAVFYPMGWDDNGLPTERRVQQHFGVRCDPSLPYKPAFEPPEWPSRQPIAVSRPNFMELCSQLTMEDEQAFEAVFRRLGLSVDWSLTYATVGEQARRASQRAFLRLLAKGLAYQADAPTLWEVDFHTAVAQAELEDRQVEGMSYRLRFADGVEVDTTRPELLAACVALVVHPDDGRFAGLLGTTVRTPLFGAEVPVLAHRLAEPAKGTGIAMLCTFGDPTDLVWWRELGLPMRPVLDPDGTIRSVAWGSPGFECADPAAAQRAHDQLAGCPSAGPGSGWRPCCARPARWPRPGPGHPDGQVLRARQPAGGDPDQPPVVRPHRQPQGRPAGQGERAVLASRVDAQPVPELGRRALGRLVHQPPALLRGAVPALVPGRPDGAVDHEHPLVPDEARLPVDPSTDVPSGYLPADRGRPGGFAGAPGVMDTWATSAITPEIAGGWVDDPDLFARVFPMDLRPQGHDIIRTWLFYSLARAHVEHGTVPWAHAVIAGWVVDPNRRKLAKSRGTRSPPSTPWSGSGPTPSATGRPASGPGSTPPWTRASSGSGGAWPPSCCTPPGSCSPWTGWPPPTDTLDRAMLAGLAGVVDEATAAFEAYEPARALEAGEAFFWTFCDHYLELVKGRAYGEAGPAGQASAVGALRLALDTLVRLFAPVLPFVTEEVWSWWRDGSVHRSPWPEGGPLRAATGVEGPAPWPWRRPPPSWPRSAGPRPPPGVPARARGRVGVADRPERLAVLAEVAADLAGPATSPTWPCSTPPTP